MSDSRPDPTPDVSRSAVTRDTRRAGRAPTGRERYLPPAISIASVVAAVLLVRRVVVSSQQWPRIRAQFFSVTVMRRCSPTYCAALVSTWRYG